MKEIEVMASAAPKICNERQAVLKMFVDKMPDTKPVLIAIKTAHLSISDLYWLNGECCKAKNFGAYFWWSIKK